MADLKDSENASNHIYLLVVNSNFAKCLEYQNSHNVFHPMHYLVNRRRRYPVKKTSKGNNSFNNNTESIYLYENILRFENVSFSYFAIFKSGGYI